MYSLTRRFRDIIDTTEKQMKITVVGAGSIGSNLVPLLARLGIQDITVYDDDIVEDHNLGHQAFGVSAIGSSKVQALAKEVHFATKTIIKPINFKTDGKDIDTDILVLAVDSMKARAEIFENAKFQFCVDGRMGGEVINVYTCSSLDDDNYKKTLYSDEEASPLSCGGRSIGYVSYLISALMEIQIKKILNEEEFAEEINFCARNLIMQTSLDG